MTNRNLWYGLAKQGNAYTVFKSFAVRACDEVTSVWLFLPQEIYMSSSVTLPLQIQPLEAIPFHISSQRSPITFHNLSYLVELMVYDALALLKYALNHQNKSKQSIRVEFKQASQIPTVRSAISCSREWTVWRQLEGKLLLLQPDSHEYYMGEYEQYISEQS